MLTLLYQQRIMKLTAMGGGMKIHKFSRGFISWEQQHEPSLSLIVCKRLRPLLPKNPTATNSVDSRDSSSVTITTTMSAGIPCDIKSFIKQDFGLSKTDIPATDKNKVQLTQVETHPVGTRWNPTQEQIGILEMLYRGGMRTPNAQQIEQITKQLSRLGKIEGKNVFYWFQNHKARERQTQKRNNLGLSHSPRRNSIPFSTITLSTREDEEIEESSPFKKKCRTLELFPLHPEGR